MEPSCVRQTLIPGTSALFSDYLYHYERVCQFFPAWFGDPDAIVRAAGAIDYPDARRAALVEALRAQNGDSENVRKLAKPGTVAVVTGQQVGLFSGPAYTIFKALTAAKLAQTLTERGIPAVPVFWLATEDHDLAEIDHAGVFDRFLLPHKLRATSAESATNGGPVGNVPVGEAPLSKLEETLRGFPFGREIAEHVAEAYTPNATYGSAFRRLLQPLLNEFDLLYLDPLAPGIRSIVNPFLQSAAQRIPELLPELRQRNKELNEAGYHAQVNVEDDTSLLFLLENGKRTPIRLDSGRFKVRADRVLDLQQNGESLSPNALLRPVMEDYLLPTLAYVGGPSEVAYMAQAEVLYRELLGRMPVIFPRNSFTLLDARASKMLDRYGLHFPDILHHHEEVRERIAAHLVPPALTTEIARLRSNMDAGVEKLQGSLRAFDSTLEAAAKKSTAKMLYQLDKLAKKTARETLRRDARASHDAEYLINLIYPERHLQERFYSIIPFLAQAGLDLPRKLWEQTQLTCPDHMLRSI